MSEEIVPNKAAEEFLRKPKNIGSGDINLCEEKYDNMEDFKSSVAVFENKLTKRIENDIDVFHMKSLIGFDRDDFFLKIKIFFKNNFDTIEKIRLRGPNDESKKIFFFYKF